MQEQIRLILCEKEFALCRLPDGFAYSAPPGDAYSFWMQTPSERSLLCRAEAVPQQAELVHADLCGLRVAGTLDHSLTGILARLTAVLADAGIPVFAFSTWDTDYLFIDAGGLEKARAALTAAGVPIEDGW